MACRNELPIKQYEHRNGGILMKKQFAVILSILLLLVLVPVVAQAAVPVVNPAVAAAEPLNLSDNDKTPFVKAKGVSLFLV